MLFGFNQLSHIDPEAFSPLTNLTYLDLANNKALPSVSDILLPASLTQLRADNNNITSVPALHFTLPPTTTHSSINNNISSNNKLRKLNLDYNPIVSISLLAFQHLTELTELWLTHTQLTSVDFSLPSSLTTLALSYSPVSSISSGTFSQLTHLRDLHLEYTHLTSVSSISSIPSPSPMTSLYLQHTPVTITNNIPDEDKDAFRNLTQLSHLFMDGMTHLTRLPLTLTHLTHLQYLSMYSLPHLTCTCMESAVATWYLARRQAMRQAGREFSVVGDCGDVSVAEFLEKLAPQCPPPVPS